MRNYKAIGWGERVDKSWREGIGEGCGNLSLFDFSPRGEWADPGGTAIPGQPVARAEQAPDISPLTKNQFNIVVPM